MEIAGVMFVKRVIVYILMCGVNWFRDVRSWSMCLVGIDLGCVGERVRSYLPFVVADQSAFFVFLGTRMSYRSVCARLGAHDALLQPPSSNHFGAQCSPNVPQKMMCLAMACGQIREIFPKVEIRKRCRMDVVM